MCRIVRTYLKIEFCRKNCVTVKFFEISFLRGCLPKIVCMSEGTLLKQTVLHFYVEKSAMHGHAAREAV